MRLEKGFKRAIVRRTTSWTAEVVLAAGAAVYLFSELLVWAGGGLLAGLVLIAAFCFWQWLRRLQV